MSTLSSSEAAWSTRLDLLSRPETVFARPDDPRLGERIEFWQGNLSALQPGRPILIGFPQDEGVRRNQGRPGAAEAPHEIRRALYRLTPADSRASVGVREIAPLDLGNVRVSRDLEASQQALGEVVAAALRAATIPLVLGGGHETAYGHYLGYAEAGLVPGVINLDAHLDVRPCLGDLGHSGSPFRQMIEHSQRPLSGSRYVCLGAQPFAVSTDHLRWLHSRGGRVHWAEDLRGRLSEYVREEIARLAAGGPVWLSLDADVVRLAEMPGVSAPNAAGLTGEEVLSCIREAGRNPAVVSFELVEVNPTFDRDGHSVRWAALALWQFLMGLAERNAA